ncbi:MAG: PAS domain S-box protein [Candidatus Lokiarchaeota archaeon]|nr:PAS domain S-box protein [Candidatus Lokiarchaeota archaeon]MBD3341934.1 PAS domain S-box protein [Candidatus Lokiarchaeota archaeon]
METKNGNILPIEFNCSVIKNGEGLNKGTILTFRDISQKIEWEERLRESEEKYRLIAEDAGDLISVYNSEAKLIYFNKKAHEKALGYDAEQLNKFKFRIQITHEADRRDQAKQFLKILKTGQAQHQFRLKHKDGHYVWFDSVGRVFADRFGRKNILFISRDISERKLMEQELRKSEEKFKGLYDSLKDGIGLTDLEGNIIDCNQAFLDMLGYTKNEILNLSFNDITPKKWHDKERSILENQVNVRGYSDEYEKEYIKNDGTVIPINIKTWLIKENNENPIGYWAIIRDISYKKAALQQLKESEERFRTLYENIVGGTLIIGKDYKIKDVNQYTCDVTGYLKEELVGQLCDIICPRGSSSHDCPIWEIGKKEFRGMDTQIKCKAEERISILKNARKIKLDGETYIFETFQDIHDRKIAEQKVKESEEKFRHLFEKAPHAIIILDTNGILIDCNSTALSFSGYLKSELIGKKILELLELFKISKMNIKIQNAFKNSLRGESKNNIEIPILTKDGRQIWITMNGSLISVGDQEYIQTIIQDITKRKEAERQLKKSEEKYRELVHNANSIILKLDVKYTIIFINEFGERFFGYRSNELIGRSVVGTLLPKKESTGRNLEKMVKKLVLNPDNYEYNENENMTKHGEIKWISWTNKGIYDQYGKLTGVLSVGTDITERKEAELALMESEEKFRSIAEQSFLGILIIQNGYIKYVNDVLTDLLDLTEEELFNLPQYEIYNLLEYPKNFGFSTNKNIKLYLSTKLDIKTGKSLWVDQYAKRIQFKAEPADLITIFDVTEKKEAEKLVIEENKKLLELNQMKNEFITRISHELKTPLNSIYGASTLLLDLYIDNINDKAKRLVEIIHKGGERLDKLILNLIDVLRIESNKLRLDKKEVSLLDMVQDCINDVIHFIEERDLFINVDVPSDIVLSVDKHRIKELILNLLTNAIKNTPQNGQITLSIQDYFTFVDVKIKDSGVGFTKEEKTQLFKRFGKIERYGKGMDIDTEGTGLGLFISKKIVELHNGEIWVESEGRNRGSTFVVRLPKS